MLSLNSRQSTRTAIRQIAAFSALTGVIASCQDQAPLIWGVRPGRFATPALTGGAVQEFIQLPDHFTVGAASVVTVLTEGGGCEKKGYDEKSIQGLAGVVSPMDSFFVNAPSNPEPRDCEAILKVFVHTSSLQFDQPGVAVIRFNGLAGAPGGTPQDTVIERTVPVNQ